MIIMLIVPVKPKAFLLRDIPPAIWQKLQIRAAREGVKISVLLRRWIQNYAEGK